MVFLTVTPLPRHSKENMEFGQVPIGVIIKVRRLHSKCGHSPYGGCEAVFPETVMVRGEVQVEDGEFCGEPLGRDVCG